MQIMDIKNLVIHVGDKEVVQDFSLVIRPNEIHALMGPNGSGKSSLAYAMAGHPEYKITSGSVVLGDADLIIFVLSGAAGSGRGEHEHVFADDRIARQRWRAGF